MAKLWLKLSAIDSQKSEPEALYEYIHLLMIGLAGSKPMITCTCSAMSTLATEFKGLSLSLRYHLFFFILFSLIRTYNWKFNTRVN